MLAKALIEKINPNKRPFERVVYEFKNNKPVPKTIVVQPMLCCIDDELGVISKNVSTYIVINKKNEVFFLKEHELNCKIDIQTKMNFKNRIPQFIDFIETEEFSLDLL